MGRRMPNQLARGRTTLGPLASVIDVIKHGQNVEDRRLDDGDALELRKAVARARPGVDLDAVFGGLQAPTVMGVWEAAPSLRKRN